MVGQAEIFNDDRINNPQWTDQPSYACRLIAGRMDGFRSTAKIYKYNSKKRDWFLCGADIHYANNLLRVEAEIMNRHSNTDDSDLLETYIQSAYTFDLPDTKMFHCLTPVARWDTMGYNVWNSKFDVKRITVGINFRLTFIPYDSILRIDYDQYFATKDFPDFDNRDLHVADNKVTVELVIKF